MNLDEIKDFAVKVVGDMVLSGIIKDCTDTDDEDEFMAQDLIIEELCGKLNIENE